MNAIRVLPEKVASQIAAGEVIERPSSVVRELIDNSIDAGADRITIRIEKGGKRLIRVADNGAGMMRDDLLLCIERHATSKINSLSDLLSIKSLGFRGEALPSIAAVSRTEITSRPADQLIGYRLTVSGGKLKSIEETGSPGGTTVEVRDLFFNVPARKKFLRAIKTEADHILDTVARIALPFLRIQFRLDDEKKSLFTLPATEKVLDRISILMGRDVAGSMTALTQEAEGLSVKAHLASPDFNRARGDAIFIYVNGRNVRDRLMTRAIMEGYGQRLMRGRYPQIVLFLDIDPLLVDINVHPTKQEVRFHRGQDVYRTIVSAIEGALSKRFMSFIGGEPSPTDRFEQRSGGSLSVSEPKWIYAADIGEQPPLDRETSKEIFPDRGALRIIGQLNDTYILCETEEGLLMIDQHAAHERILYEELRERYDHQSMERQAFLIPQRFELSLKDGKVLESNIQHLNDLGLEFEHFGGHTFLLRSVPSLLLNMEWENFLRDLLSVLEEGGSLQGGDIYDHVLNTMACHGAIKAGKQMTVEEMDALLEQMKPLKLPSHCPHGRPVFKKLSFYEIEKMFKRVV